MKYFGWVRRGWRHWQAVVYAEPGPNEPDESVQRRCWQWMEANRNHRARGWAEDEDGTECVLPAGEQPVAGVKKG